MSFDPRIEHRQLKLVNTFVAKYAALVVEADGKTAKSIDTAVADLAEVIALDMKHANDWEDVPMATRLLDLSVKISRQTDLASLSEDDETGA